MATISKNVVFGSEWGECETCGRCWPTIKLRRHPRFGVQCPDDWDGGPHRDELHYRARPREGTRRSNFGICDANEGIEAGDSLAALALRWFDQASPTTYWDVVIDSAGISWTTSPTRSVVGGWNLDGVWSLYIRNGFLTWTLGPVARLIPKPSDADVSVDSGGILVVN